MTTRSKARTTRHVHAFRIVRLPAIALGLGLLITACNAAGSTARQEQNSPQVVLEEVLDAMLREPYEGAADAYLASLPAALTSRSRFVTNAYDPGQRDEIETLTYDGLTITVYHVGTTDRRFPVEVTASAPIHGTASGLRVGLTRTEVRARLGAPTTTVRMTAAQQATLPTWHYARFEDGVTPHSLDINFEDDVVSALRWSVQVD